MSDVARRMWHLLEPVHAVTYFAPEARAAADAAGLKGFWMGYAAQRIAPLGPVGPEVAGAAFFVFHRSRLERALPDAWTFASPDTCRRARSEGAVAAMRRIVAEAGAAITDGDVAEAADLAGRAASSCDPSGRVLTAANRALVVPAEPWAALWAAATTLREHRGDGHVAALVAHGLDPVAAQLLKTASGEAPADWMRDSRGWPHERWDAGVADLRDRGLLDDRGGLTDAGRATRTAVEDATDAAAAAPWHALGDAGVDRLGALLSPIARAVFDTGTVPAPNPIGLPRTV